jgi:hypothetical protein
MQQSADPGTRQNLRNEKVDYHSWRTPAMEVKSCRVAISDMEGIAHTVEVTAATLYEAVALGLKQLQGNEWVEGIARG